MVERLPEGLAPAFPFLRIGKARQHLIFQKCLHGLATGGEFELLHPRQGGSKVGRPSWLHRVVQLR